MKNILIFVIGITATFLVGCSSLQLQPADFSWAAEEVIEVKSNGTVDAKRYSVSFNINALLAKEFAADSASAKNTKEVNLIRDKAGYYYLTGVKFKNVYVLSQSEGALSVSNTLALPAEKAVEKPVFDQKDSYIELKSGADKYQVNKGSIQPAGGKK